MGEDVKRFGLCYGAFKKFNDSHKRKFVSKGDGVLPLCWNAIKHDIEGNPLMPARRNNHRTTSSIFNISATHLTRNRQKDLQYINDDPLNACFTEAWQ